MSSHDVRLTLETSLGTILATQETNLITSNFNSDKLLVTRRLVTLEHPSNVHLMYTAAV